MNEIINFSEILEQNLYNKDIPFITLPTKEEISYNRCYDVVMNHINGTRSLRMEYELILKKKSRLSKKHRDWVCIFF